MNYLLKRNGRYYFNRRVPLEIQKFDAREIIRFSLKTRDYHRARKIAFLQNEKIESHWAGLLGIDMNGEQSYQEIVNFSNQLGIPYKTVQDVAKLPLDEFLQRLLYLKDAPDKKVTLAVAGGVQPPVITVDEALNKFWDLSKDRVVG